VKMSLPNVPKYSHQLGPGRRPGARNRDTREVVLRTGQRLSFTGVGRRRFRLPSLTTGQRVPVTLLTRGGAPPPAHAAQWARPDLRSSSHDALRHKAPVNERGGALVSRRGRTAMGRRRIEARRTAACSPAFGR
jgi:hypothetical protein